MKRLRTRYQRGTLASAIAEKIRRDSKDPVVRDLAEWITIALYAPMPILQDRIARSREIQSIMEAIPE